MTYLGNFDEQVVVNPNTSKNHSIWRVITLDEVYED